MFFLIHLITAIALAEAEKRTAVNILSVSIVNFIIVGLLIFLGRRVRQGRNLTAALFLIWSFFLGRLQLGQLHLPSVTRESHCSLSFRFCFS